MAFSACGDLLIRHQTLSRIEHHLPSRETHISPTVAESGLGHARDRRDKKRCEILSLLRDLSMMLHSPWPAVVLLAGFLVALGAGIVRGFSGFGFSALTVAGLSLFVPPATVVPAVLSLEVLASVSLIRGAIPDSDRGWLGWLLLGNAVCIPLGIAALVVLPETQVRFLVGGVLLVSATLLKAAGGRSLAPTLGLRIVAGVVSGLLNGVAASGGIAAALLMAASRLSAVALRGTMITFLLFAGAYFLIWAGILGRSATASTPLLGAETLRWVGLLAPAMFGGIWIGRRSFRSADPASYRAFVLNLLIVISGLGVLRSVLELIRG